VPPEPHDPPGAGSAEAGRHPGVSVIMPVVDEERHLAAAVRRILSQDYPGPLEVVLALGPSRDGTDRVAAELADHDPRVRSVPNPSGRTPSGLNAALAATRHEIVVRVDGHAMIPPDYVRVGVETLERTGADNVGGIMAAEGTTPFEHAVARAMTSWFGVGGAPFHVGGEEGPALTVYLGCFRRSALERVGGYDESMLRAQDWELNLRLRSTGGVVWFTPRMGVTYHPRPDVSRLSRQYFDYGRWRREVVTRHPETLSARYLAAPVAVAAVAGGTLLAGLAAAAGRPRLAALGLAAPLGYAAANLLASAVTGRGLPAGAARRLPLVYATMHGSWGLGFLRGGADGATGPR
jgi:glycosyltransferase involved in cell wall biosynthesis